MTPAEQVAAELTVTDNDVEPTTAPAAPDVAAALLAVREVADGTWNAEQHLTPGMCRVVLALLDEARAELQAERVEHDRLLFAAAEAAGRTERVLAADVEDLTRALARVTAERDMALDQFQIVKQEMDRLAEQVQQSGELIAGILGTLKASWTFDCGYGLDAQSVSNLISRIDSHYAVLDGGEQS